MILKKGDTSNITTNFTANELFSKSFNAPDQHFLSDGVVKAAQFLRTTFGVPVKVNSSYRTPEHNTKIGGATNSQHVKGNALDLSFPKNENILLQLQQSVLKQDSLFNSLRAMGINGIGLYDTFIHIDTRPGNYAFWDRRITTKKKLQP